jgi:hypothetical protein
MFIGFLIQFNGDGFTMLNNTRLVLKINSFYTFPLAHFMTQFPSYQLYFPNYPTSVKI